MLDVRIANFACPPLNALNGNVVHMRMGPLDVVRGAVTIRRPATAALQLRNWLDYGATALQIIAALRGGGPFGLTGSGPLQAAAYFTSLDPSEKASISYRVGMGIAHVLAKELLGAVEVGHLDAARRAGLVNFASDRKQPDLVGLDRSASDVLVIEAKGRSNGGVRHAITQAKVQAENVLEAGTNLGNFGPPLYRIASVADLSKTPLEVRFVDPPAGDDDLDEGASQAPARLRVEPELFTRSYYGAVAELAELSGELTADIPGLPAGLPARGSRLPGTRIWLALADSVSEALQESDDRLVARVRRAQELWQREHVTALRPNDLSPTGSEGDAELNAWTSVGGDGFLLHVEPGAIGS